mmetsp:Transcript_40360/g.114192  ORF Transcript_40360/g.114192 Transcript_40360/m.114192 type:complete len:219 (-) Transcript_40360:7-663(-)
MRPSGSPSSPGTFSRKASESSRLASRICAKLMRIRLLVAALFWTDTRSKCFTLSNDLPAQIGMLGVPTEAPSWSIASANPPPASRSSWRKHRPAPRRKDSNVPAAAVNAVMTSFAIDFRAGSMRPSATAAEAPNFVMVCCRSFAIFFNSSGGRMAESTSSPSVALSSNSLRMSCHTRAAALKWWSSAIADTSARLRRVGRPGRRMRRGLKTALEPAKA